MSDGIATINEIKPGDARGYEGDLYVQNLTLGTVMYSGKDGFTLGPKGSTTEVQHLPHHIATAPDFQRLWRREKVRVIDQASYDSLIVKIDERDREERERRDQEVRAVIEPSPDSREMYPVRNSHGEVTFETKAQKEASGREGLADDENLVSLGQVPIVTGYDESTGQETVQNVKVTVTETLKEGN